MEHTHTQSLAVSTLCVMGKMNLFDAGKDAAVGKRERPPEPHTSHVAATVRTLSVVSCDATTDRLAAWFEGRMTGAFQPR